MRFLPLALYFAAMGFGPAWADDAPPASDPSAPPTVRATRHGGKMGKRAGSTKGKASSGAVRGHCTLLESPLNPLTGPCISVPLELKDQGGRSLGISRTSAQGDFEFAIDGDVVGPFSLAPSSGYYVLVGPAATIRKGQPIDLKIREKN